MTRPVKIALGSAAALAVLAAAVLIAGLLILQSQWLREKIRARIVEEIENATGGGVELAKFDFDWRALTAEVRGLVVHGDEGAGQAPLFRAQTVQVDLRILSVWKKQVDLESVAVTRPEVNLIVYPDGRTNLPHPKVARRRTRSTIETVLDLAIKRFRITDGNIHAGLRTLPLDVAGEDLEARVFWESGPPRYRGDLAFRRLSVTPAKGGTLPVDFRAGFTVAQNRLEIRDAHMAHKGSSVDLGGTVEDFAAPRAELDYTARVDLADLPPEVRFDGVPHRGAAAFTGRASFTPSAGYSTRGRMRAEGLAVNERGVRVRNIGAVSDYAVSAEGARFSRLVVSALGGTAAGEAEILAARTFRVKVNVAGFSLEDLTHVEGIRSVPWNGAVSGPVEIAGSFPRGAQTDVNVKAELSIAPAAGANPVEGAVNLQYRRRGNEIDFTPSRISTRFSELRFSGTLGKRLEVSARTTNLDDALPAIAMFSAEPPEPLPVSLSSGTARFDGTVTGPLKDPMIQGKASASRLVWENRTWDHADADLKVSRTGVQARAANVRKGRIRASGAVDVGLDDWKDGPQSPLSGTFRASAPDVADFIAELGAAASRTPVSSGPVAASGTLAGTLGSPEAAGHVQAARAVAWGQPLDRVQADARYTEGLLDVRSSVFESPAGRVQLTGSFEHPKSDWTQGRARFQLVSREIALGSVREVQQRSPGLQGRMEVNMTGEIAVEPGGFRPGAFNGWVAARGLAVDREQLGSLSVEAVTADQAVNARLEGELAGSKVAGTSRWSLTGNYPAKGRIDFTALRFSTLLARLGGTRGANQPPFTGSAAGSIEFSGSTLDSRTWQVQVSLPTVEVRPAGNLVEGVKIEELTLRNAGPVLVDVTSRGASFRQAAFRAKDTNLTVSGGVGFGVRNPWDLRVRGAVNLALARDFDSSASASGALDVDVSVRGALSQPDIYGRVELRNASLSYTGFPNGIDRASGVIFLYRDRATIDRLSAETGGGKIELTGFFGYGDLTTFNLQAKASDVRIRYPEGVSSTINANLTLVGSLDRSTLSGDAVITRVAFNPRSDLGSILASSARPTPVPARPSRFLSGVRFAVRIVTSPQVRFETSLTRDVQADADLRLRGDPLRPVLLGRILINQGDIVFFGNTYSINSGQILFVNTSKIDPTVNLDLETRARGVEISLHISGPVDRMNVSYRSDPPLPFSDIVTLLTTGRQPANTPGLTGTSGSSSSSTQNWDQAGATALLSQAIASPIAGRLQRFFGVSRLKIDPTVTGLTTNNAAARITVEQQITGNLVLTYITDLSRAQAQVIRVEWDFTRNWSGVALREENGLFGIDFLYKKQVK